MGLSRDSTGLGAAAGELLLPKRGPDDFVIALAGNPNVGKSTVFNALTGMHQHTGNWPGKTVSNAQGTCRCHGHGLVLVDLPGCYSLLAHSAEEEVARDFLCFGSGGVLPDAAIAVCDATCLERNLNLVLQMLEITPNVVVCVNLMDEARRKGIEPDLQKLSKLLGVPVVGAAARSGQGLDRLTREVVRLAKSPRKRSSAPAVTYSPDTEAAVEQLLPAARRLCGDVLDPRWLALRLLDDSDPSLDLALEQRFGASPRQDPEVRAVLSGLRRKLAAEGRDLRSLRDDVTAGLVRKAESLSAEAADPKKSGYSPRDRMLDRLFTGKYTGFPILLLLLLFLFWLTAVGANYPSQLLSALFFRLGAWLHTLFLRANAPGWLTSLLLDGMYKTLSWVVSVMLPPMAIFFPLFTLLEDLGYLPRVAFDLDRCFQKCGACGKQALTTCMGFGCNAAGVVGCRIIDSPRERLIAMLTNNFVPCNGRLPMLLSLIAMFFGTAAGAGSSLLSSLLLLGLILLGVAMTFAVSKLLSCTLLKGAPSSFTLELPPYRRPQLGKVIVRSVCDRTLFVLGRAAAVAAPAGLLLWAMANLQVGGASLLNLCAGALDPFARLFGLDGVILLAFLLGLPANEIVIPIIVMAYMAQGSLMEMTDLAALKALLTENGWTWVTALCTMLFSLMHWPCSTACMTIRKESQSWKWTAVAFLLPTLCGLALCFLVASAARLFGL